MQRQMKLGLNIVANGAHAAGWRMPGAQADAALDIRLWKRMAQAAEAARIHFMFWADGIAVRHSARDDDELSYNRPHRRIRAVDPDRRPGRGHPADRLPGQRVHHLQRPLSPGPQVRLARPHQRGPGGLERGHVLERAGGVQLRPRRAHGTRAALPAGGGVRRCRVRPVGQLGRRCVHPRQGRRAVFRPGQAAHPEPPRRDIRGEGAAERGAPGAGLSGDRAGRVVGAGAGSRARGSPT